MSARLKRKTVRIRGEDFIVREWTPAERAAALKMRETDVLLFSACVAHACTIKENGSRLFPSEDAARNEPAELIDALAAEVLVLSGVHADEDDEKNG